MSLRAAAADLLLGGACPGCGRPGWSLCRACTASLLADPHLVGRPWEDLPPTYASCLYEGPAHRLVIQTKERGVWRGCVPLGQAVARAAAALLLAVDAGEEIALVPVPSAAAAVRRRGSDTTARLTVEAARVLRATGLRVEVARCLRQRRGVKDQVGLSARERAANLSRKIVCAAAPPTRPVIVVDDVVTTGASLMAATTALREAGADVIGCACAAARGWK